MAATAPRAERATATAARAEAPAPWQRLVRGLGRAAGVGGGPPAGDAIRRLAVASGGSVPGLAMADVVGLLWTTLLKFDAADPAWPDRDRFVLCDDPGGRLLQMLLRLTGQAVADGHPAFPALPNQGGPHGQALATAIGLALAERMLAGRFGRSLVDHRTWIVAGEADLAGGLSHEAICLAGELRLGRLAVLYDGGDAPPADLAKRFNAAGWAVRDIGGHDPAAIAAALSFAQRSRKPSLICCRTHDRADTIARLPEDARLPWGKAGQRGATARRAWLKRLAQHPLRADFERALSGRRPDEWRDAMAALRAEATAPDSRPALDALLQAVPELLGCTADRPPVPSAQGHEAYRARRLGFGRREHGMAAAMNGIALHGGWLPVGHSPAGAADALRPALRLAAITRQQVIHVVTPSDQEHAAEHLAALRAIPEVMVFRPADAAETIECWEVALRRADGPCVIFQPEPPVPPLPRAGGDNHTARGGYVLVEPPTRRCATLIATGPEVAVALAAEAALATAGLPVAVVSLPCWEAFAAQDDAYRAAVLGSAPRIGIEAACGFGWERWLGTEGRFIGIDAPPGLYNHFGITPDTVIAAVRALAGRP